jgi:hypothetical protein
MKIGHQSNNEDGPKIDFPYVAGLAAGPTSRRSDLFPLIIPARGSLDWSLTWSSLVETKKAQDRGLTPVGLPPSLVEGRSAQETALRGTRA